MENVENINNLINDSYREFIVDKETLSASISQDTSLTAPEESVQVKSNNKVSNTSKQNKKEEEWNCTKRVKGNK